MTSMQITQASPKRHRWRSVLLAVMLITGVLCAWWLAARADRALREDLLRQTHLVAEALNLERVRSLTGTEADLTSPVYLRIKDQFGAVRSAFPAYRFIYLMGRQADGTVFFYADSEPAGLEDESPTGQVYQEISEDYLYAFDTKTALTVGPVIDRWGTWVSSLVPLSDPYTGELMAVLGMDLDARDWRWKVAARSILPAGILTLALLVIVLIGSHLLTQRPGGPPPQRSGHLEPALVVAFGLVLTVFTAWLAQDESNRIQARSFQHLAESRTAALGQTFRTLRDVELEGLAKFYQGSDTIMEEEFLNYTAFLTRNRAVQAWEWVPAVPASEKEGFEQAARAVGPAGFEIWQLDAAGNRVPATDREIYYPVFRIAPEEGNRQILGFDLGSEPVRRSALEEALRTGLPTATDPVPLLRETDRRPGMLIFHPVFTDSQNTRLQGFALVVVRLSDVLAVTGPDDVVAEELLLARADAEPVSLVSSWPPDRPPLTGLTVQRPLFAFGNTFIVAAHAGPEFLQLHPARGGLLAMLMGMILTFAVAVVFSLLLRRGQALETLVRERTSALRENEEHLSATLRSIGDGVIACDHDGRITSLNRAAETLTGWSSTEAEGRPIQEVFHIINTETRQSAENPVARALRDGVSVELANQTALIAQDGTEYQIADSCAPIRDSSGAVIGAVLVFRDVTEEYRRREKEHLDLNFHSLVAEVSALFAQVRDHRTFDEAVDFSLASLGGVFWVDRSYLFRFSEDLSTMNNTHEWCVPGISSQKHRIQQFPTDSLPWLKSRMLELRPIQVPLVSALPPEAAIEQSEFQSQGIQSLLCLPIRDNRQRLIGFMGFDAVRVPFTWPEDQVGMLQVLGEIIGSTIARVEATLALAENEKQLTMFFSQSLSGFFIMMLDEPIEWNDVADKEKVLDYAMTHLRGTRVNQAMLNQYGATEEDFIGLTPEQWFAHDPEQGRYIWKGLFDLGRLHVETRERRKDGTPIIIDGDYICLYDKQGRITGHFGVQTDVTERKRADEELRETNRQLEEATARANEMALQAELANIAKSEFLANMSHEIRTPMNGVIGMTGLLLDTDLSEEQCRYAEIVKISGESLLGLINDILDFSKIEAGKLELETLDFDLSDLLDDFAATMALRTHDKGLELICAADPAVPVRLQGDPGRLRQILINLTGNAIKFTREGEVAVLVMPASPSPGAPAPLTGPDVLLYFSVRDTGIGIPADKIGLLFSKFTQVDASTTRKYGGTGLGLAISKQLAELMGGEIGVRSVEGRGSEFWFTARFTLQPANQGEGIDDFRSRIFDLVDDNALDEQSKIPPLRAAPPSADLAGVRVLIVDDNATNREILTTRLAAWGMRPGEAPDGPAGLQALYRALAEGDPCRLAIVDMQMPGMDGATLGRLVRADDQLTDTQLVMLTSLGTRGDARHFQEIGFAGYAVKPIRHEELRGVLSQVLAGGRGQAGSPQPIATRHSAREARPRLAERQARILLAEDNITNQQVALGILKNLGLTADAVANGQEAVEALKLLPYDLVLMDVQMPEMDGLAATRAIRAPQSGVLDPGIPIIAMTAHAMQGDRERCLAAGMNDYVAKPVAPQALAGALEKWLPKEPGDRSRESGVGSREARPDRHASPVIWDRTGMLERLMSDEDLAGTILQGFLEDMPRQIEALERSVEAGDAATAERIAHTIKGASANMGGEQLRALAFEMEQAGKAGDLKSMKAQLDELDAAFEQLKVTMEGDPPCAS